MANDTRLSRRLGTFDAVVIGGVAGCAALAFTLPISSVIEGASVLVAGSLGYGLERLSDERRPD